ncbi:MAG: HAD family hydrolase [Nitrospirae bacterium]|nr:HAD family hydrolase [Nitrospirota bacterium]
MIKAIIFDFDGVLVESVDIKTNAFAKLFESEGKEIVEKVVNYHLKNSGISRYEKFRYIYREILVRSLSDEEFEVLCNRFATIVKDSVVEAPYVRGALQFLEKYSAVYRCFIVTATPQKEIEEIVQRRGIAGFFKGIYGAPLKKEDTVKAILSSEGTRPQEAVYIGDALSDYNAAVRNGVNFIARIYDRVSIFEDKNYLKTEDLTSLYEIIKTFENKD